MQVCQHVPLICASVTSVHDIKKDSTVQQIQYNTGQSYNSDAVYPRVPRKKSDGCAAGRKASIDMNVNMLRTFRT